MYIYKFAIHSESQLHYTMWLQISAQSGVPVASHREDKQIFFIYFGLPVFQFFLTCV
jgi:hypothetical protein